MNMDINNTPCIVKQMNLLSNKYINLCTGAETDVSHGLVTLIVGGSIVFLLVGSVLTIAGIICLSIWESFS